MTGEIRRGGEGPTAIHTKLGWVLSGPAPRIEPTHSSHNLFITHALHVGHRESDTGALNQTMQSFWNLESLGVVDPCQSIYTDFEKDIQFENGRYEVSLPWKDPHLIIPDNYHQTATWSPTTSTTGSSHAPEI